MKPRLYSYSLLVCFNLGKYPNSELSWTMNTNNSLPSWRLLVAP